MPNNDEYLAKNISLCDALDRLLTKGVVIYGDISISVAGVDLLYIGLRGLVCAIDALEEIPASLRSRPTSSPSSCPSSSTSAAHQTGGQS